MLNAEARRDLGEDSHHEGELTSAHRLICRLHTTYGTFIDALVFDALYANGPVMTKLDECGYGGFIVLKKDNNEPLKEALALWEGQSPCDRFYDTDKKENVKLWDVDDLETLDTYKGKVRVIRAVITKEDVRTEAPPGSGLVTCHLSCARKRSIQPFTFSFRAGHGRGIRSTHPSVK